MEKAPTIWTLSNLRQYIYEGPKTEKNGRWLPARPIGFFSLPYRVKAACLVFRGKADALVWPQDED